MIQVQYCKAYDAYKLQDLTNSTIESIEEDGNEVINVQSLVTSDKAFYSQIVYEKRSCK